jgi:hypothetical protein
MAARFFSLTILTIPLLFGCTGRVLPERQLEAMWVERMLQGRSEAASFPAYSDTLQIARSPNPYVELPVEKGIVIQDFRGSYLWNFFGTRLSEGGGLELQGGRLRAVTLDDTSGLELYILRITRWHPALFPLWGNYYRKSDVSFKVFLLRRKQATGAAVILRTWEIPPNQVKWEKDPKQIYIEVVRPTTTASLTYDPKEKRATVSITGTTQDRSTHVEIDRDAR